MLKIIKFILECSKVFLILTGLLAVFVGYNYLTKKPRIVIERYDPFVAVEMGGFYTSIRIRDEYKFEKVQQIEKIFKELKVPSYNNSGDPKGRYIIFPLETGNENNLIKLWNKKGEEIRAKRTRPTEEEKRQNRYNNELMMAGYENTSSGVASDARWYLENSGSPWSFFSLLNIPPLNKYGDDRKNYYDNVFEFKDNYIQDVFKAALEKIDDISLKSDFLESFTGNRYIWTPFIVKNKGNATAKNIQIIFQSGNVSNLHGLIKTNLNHQGISYLEHKDIDKPLYLLNSKNNVLGIPLLKPDKLKVIVIKSTNLLPEDDILQIKNYAGEEMDEKIIKWILMMFIVISVLFVLGIPLINNSKKDENQKIV